MGKAEIINMDVVGRTTVTFQETDFSDLLDNIQEILMLGTPIHPTKLNQKDRIREHLHTMADKWVDDDKKTYINGDTIELTLRIPVT